MRFKKIVLLDITGLQEWAIKELQQYSQEKIITYDSHPTTEEEKIKRIGDADGVLVSFHSDVSAEVLAACPNIKYVGLCCSFLDEKSCNVDFPYANAHGITIKGVKDYGDQGAIEYIVSELIRLVKGTGNLQWKSIPVELTKRKIGIIGLGATGKMLAKRARAFDMYVYYYSRNRKMEEEAKGIEYLPLKELLAECEIISIHLPKRYTVINSEEFKAMGNGKILVNTSLGVPYDRDAFLNWIQHEDNYAIIDGCDKGQFQEDYKGIERIISTPLIVGMTHEAKNRLSTKVLKNIEIYLEQ